MSSLEALSRRDLLRLGAGAAVVGATGLAIASPLKAARPLAISSANGVRTVEKAMEMLKAGEDTLDAAIAGVNIVELDPNDMSVGYGGLPNEDGVVELDASVMHGPTYRAGAVASLQGIKTPSKVAKVVMQRSDHVLMVGPGALAFAKAHGFEEENLLTDASRKAWLRWKERLSKEDDWLDDEEVAADFKRPTGTITCLTLNDKGDISGTTTTSGLAFKIPGRVGDSPIIGAGLYVDNEVGACGSTGRGEAVLISCGSRTVVENMRHGMSPEQAILDVLKRICNQTKSPRLLASPGKPNFDVNFYAFNKRGEHAGGRIYKGGKYAVNDGTSNGLKDSVYLFDSMPR